MVNKTPIQNEIPIGLKNGEKISKKFNKIPTGISIGIGFENGETIPIR